MYFYSNENNCISIWEITDDGLIFIKGSKDTNWCSKVSWDDFVIDGGHWHKTHAIVKILTKREVFLELL